MGDYDPGIRNQIFQSMIDNDNSLRELDERYITANPMVKCDSEWTEKIYHNFEDYVRYVCIQIKSKSYATAC